MKASGISYLQDRQSVVAMPGYGRQARCIMLTHFQVHHMEADQRRLALEKWQLGDLEDGEELLGIYFECGTCQV